MFATVWIQILSGFICPFFALRIVKRLRDNQNPLHMMFENSGISSADGTDVLLHSGHKKRIVPGRE